MKLNEESLNGIPHTRITNSTTEHDVDSSVEWKRDGYSYDKGPDQLLPSLSICTWHADGAVKINKSGDFGDLPEMEPMSVPRLLEIAAEKGPETVAMAVKRDGAWQTWTYKRYLQEVRTIAKGFIHLGLEPFHSVCILGINSPEWFISDLAAIHAGGFATGIYTTNSAESCAFVAKDSKAQIIVVEDGDQLEKILRVKDALPELKAIVQYTGEPSDPTVYSWSKLMLLGEQEGEDRLRYRLAHIAINQCCTLVYTSGTTGNPKGVMLSHDNMTWAGRLNCHLFRVKECDEKYVSFLPLSHCAAQIADLYCGLANCSSIYFADKNAFKGSLVETMKEVETTIMFAVPRLWEKMYEKMQEIGKTVSWPKKLVANWAKSKGLEYHMKRLDGVEQPDSLGFQIANKLVLSKVRDALGLAKCNIQISGGGPLEPEIVRYFLSLNILVGEVYGMSECSGTHTLGTESQFRLGSVGKTMSGASTKLHNVDGKGNGEVCMLGRHVFMGYLNQPDLTTGTIDKDGWLHTGDVGKLDKDGYLYITGRIKELLITAGGENVAPVPIENNVKEALPVVSQALLVGDKHKFLSILLTLKTEVDLNTLKPLETLLPSTREWVNENGDCKVDTVEDVLRECYEKKNSKLISAFQAAIDEANTKAPSHAQRIQKWHLLPVDFSIPGGEFGPTLKLKRATVLEKYQDIVNKLYL